MGRRLLIAFVLVLGLSVLWWYIVPKFGVPMPWFVPMLGYGIIVVATLAPVLAEMRQWRKRSREEEIRTPDPGPSPEDLERFGDPWLKLTDRRD